MGKPPPTVERTDVYEAFCQEYVRDFKGGPAARRAGIENPATARSWASRALARPEVRARIEELKAERRQRVQVETDDVLRKLLEIANTDVNELVEFRRTCCRHCWGRDHRYQYTDGGLRAARVRHEQDLKKAQREGRDLTDDLPLEFDEQGGGGFDATRDPHPECPECNGEGVGTPFIKDTRDLGLAATAYAGVKVTKEGVELKLHDRMKAIELLGKHLGMFTDNVKHSGQVTVVGLSSRMRNRVPGGDLV